MHISVYISHLLPESYLCECVDNNEMCIPHNVMCMCEPHNIIHYYPQYRVLSYKKPALWQNALQLKLVTSICLLNVVNEVHSCRNFGSYPLNKDNISVTFQFNVITIQDVMKNGFQQLPHVGHIR